MRHIVGSDGNWSELHRQIKALTDPEQDERRIHFLLRNDLATLRRDTGALHERWALVHGLWALNGSDRTVCQIDNEIEILMSHGCWEDSAFRQDVLIATRRSWSSLTPASRSRHQRGTMTHAASRSPSMREPAAFAQIAF